MLQQDERSARQSDVAITRRVIVQRCLDDKNRTRQHMQSHVLHFNEEASAADFFRLKYNFLLKNIPKVQKLFVIIFKLTFLFLFFCYLKVLNTFCFDILTLCTVSILFQTFYLRIRLDIFY